MSWKPERHHPALFRAGDIGVSSEWRDLSYDWWPIVTMAGIGTYTMLRDSYAHQRNLFPFLLEPEGPAKTQIQYTHGYKTGNALRGSEYLLEVVGLVVVTTGYRPSLIPTVRSTRALPITRLAA